MPALHPVERVTIEPIVEDEELERLVEATHQGDAAAWKQLWAALEPPLSRIVAQPRFLGRLGQREDDRKNIVLNVITRLRAENFARLGLYLEAKQQNPKLRFLSWLRVVAKRVGIDYLRAHPDYLRRHDADASRPGVWVDPGTLPPASQLFGQRPPMTIQGTAHELLAYAKGAIPEDQYQAIELWSRSESFDDIAKTLKLASPQAAEKMVRAALERLRRKFRPEDDAKT
jgi:DNA-directed RNA polymerase specialized sigma24 family protein